MCHDETESGHTFQSCTGTDDPEAIENKTFCENGHCWVDDHSSTDVSGTAQDPAVYVSLAFGGGLSGVLKSGAVLIQAVVAEVVGGCSVNPQCEQNVAQTAGQVVDVSQSKIDYLLSNSGKAPGFTELGYTAETLKPELEGIGRTVSSTDFSKLTEWGPRFEKTLEVGSPDVVGRINTVWQVDNGTNILRLLTAWAEVFK